MGDVMSDFLETPGKSYKPKPAAGIARIKRPKLEKAKITNMNKEQFKKARLANKAEIVKLKQSIKRHKLLIKQAKILYKLSQMKGEK